MTTRTPNRPAGATPGRIDLPDRPTAVGVEVGVGGRSPRLILLRRGHEVWLVPGFPNGWEQRIRWYGDCAGVNWMSGPAAIAVWQSVGAPVSEPAR